MRHSRRLFILVLLSCIVCSPFPFILQQLGYSGGIPGSAFTCQFFRISSASVRFLRCLLGSPFLSFFRLLPSLSFFGNYHYRSPAGFLHIHFSVLPDSVSLHAALLILFSFRLVRYHFDALNAFLAIRLLVSSTSLWFFSSFDSFHFRFFSPTVPHPSLACVGLCVLFLLSRISVVDFPFHFPFVFVGLDSDVFVF